MPGGATIDSVTASPSASVQLRAISTAVSNAVSALLAVQAGARLATVTETVAGADCAVPSSAGR